MSKPKLAVERLSYVDRAHVILRRELASRPRFPLPLMHVLMALQSDLANPAWEALKTDDSRVSEVISMAWDSLDASLKEVQRPPSSIETARIERVIALAKELRTAINDSPLPADTVSPAMEPFQRESHPNVHVWIGWRDITHEPPGFPIAVVDVLGAAIEMAEAHIGYAPSRAVTRQASRPLVTAFVRRLARQFQQRWGKEHPTVVAHITNAVLGLLKKDGEDTLPELIGYKQVVAILKDSPYRGTTT